MLDKILADKILEDFVDVCDDLNIRYCLAYGICLGFYREGGYIPWDSDLDVWIDCDPIKDGKFYVMLDRLRGLGFAFQSDNHRFCRDNVWLDIFRGDYDGILSFVETFDTIVYNNRTYNIPYPVEGYLEHMYGEDWRIPNPDWRGPK